ncbi:hypothetical protein DSCO28_70870 [Desulfosarcina ovata subsp. sediminis]|uniref:PEP-CTERM protein-sorting domain-containing protein n=1 Tax=Desulfosarcina ovata subsp. sediminis TaxID=885957 RepID=A0A5K8A251_9BACT|nr:VPLPA-CTERM sorting domain-containing protein [Desulfosarcina ovata]BBO86521.1 hypothetical protein DSCO28_70870 [Desulfosarcina ovata subsp. sediminis]
MKKATLISVFVITMVAFGTSSAMAWTIDLYNIDEYTLGLQFLVDEDAGETFSTSTYQLNVIPDDGYVSSTHDILVNSTYNIFVIESPETLSDAATDEKIGDWAGYTMGTTAGYTISEDLQIGTVTFDYEVTAGEDITWGYSHLDFGGNFNTILMTGEELFAAGNLSYNGVSAAVPVPAAVWLLGSGLLGLVGLRRRNN